MTGLNPCGCVQGGLGATQKSKKGGGGGAGSVVSTGSDSVCLTAGVFLWPGELSAGWLIQTFAAVRVRISVIGHTTLSSCHNISFDTAVWGFHPGFTNLNL